MFLVKKRPAARTCGPYSGFDLTQWLERRSERWANRIPVTGITNRYYFFGKKVIGKKSICDGVTNVLYHLLRLLSKDWRYYTTRFSLGQRHFCPKKAAAGAGEFQHVLQKLTISGGKGKKTFKRWPGPEGMKKALWSPTELLLMLCFRSRG